MKVMKPVTYIMTVVAASSSFVVDEDVLQEVQSLCLCSNSTSVRGKAAATLALVAADSQLSSSMEWSITPMMNRIGPWYAYLYSIYADLLLQGSQKSRRAC